MAGRLRALALFLALLVGAEIALRAGYVSPSRITPHDRFGFVHDSQTRIVHGREGWASHRTDSLGHFDNGLQREASRRVLVAGDSFTEALSVSRTESYVALLEASLADVDVVNLGLSGRTPFQSADYALAMAAEHGVDGVVLQLSDQDWDELRSPPVDGSAGGTPPRSGTRAAVRWAVRHSALAAFTLFRVRELVVVESHRLRGKFTVAGPPPPRPSVSSGLNRVLERLQSAGHPVVVVYIPDLDYERTQPGLRVPGVRDAYRAVCLESGVPFVDPTDALLASFARDSRPGHGFQNSRLGEGHLNALGHRVVATVLTPVVTEALR